MTKKFKVGDKVVIREWDDMKRQFGVLGDVIQCRSLFAPSMRCLCGKEFVITKIENSVIVHGHGFGWVISVDMIELADDNDNIEIDTEQIDMFINCFSIL